MNSRVAILMLLIIVVLAGIVVFDQIKLRGLEEAMGRVLVLSNTGDSLVVYHPVNLKERQVLLTPEFVDSFTDYKSPFWDGVGEGDVIYQELINEYVENRFQDHYGCKRGSKRARRIHEGTDLFVPENTPVYPLADYGVVVEVSHNPNHTEWVEYTDSEGRVDTMQVEYGKIVKILYPEGITSTYVHLNAIYVEAGDEVRGDTKVGLTGVTGNLVRSGKASHLHLEVRYLDGKSFDSRHRLHYRGTSFKRFVEMLKL